MFCRNGFDDSTTHSFPVPHPRDPRMPHLLLQLEHAVHQRFSRRRTCKSQNVSHHPTSQPQHGTKESQLTTRNINIHRHDPVTAPRHTITIMIVPAPIRTAPHAHHPPRLRHLIVHLPQRGGHLIRQRPRHDHDIALSRRRAENYTESILVVARRGQVHHLDGAARKAEGHGPEGALARPVGDLVEGGESVLHGAFFGFLAGEGDFAAEAACDGEVRGIGGG